MELSEFENIATGEELYSKSNKITNVDLGTIESYMRLRIDKYGYDGMYPYFIHPLFGELTSNFRFRFIEVVLGEDSVLIPFKYVCVMTTRYNRLFGYPISKNGISENETLIYDIIESKSLAKNIMLSSRESDSEEFFDNDFYNIVSDRLSEIENQRWVQKRLGRCLKIDGLSFRKLNMFDQQGVLAIHEKWKSHHSKITNKKLVPNLANYFGNGVDGYGVFYNGRMLAFAYTLDTFRGEMKHLVAMNFLPIEGCGLDENGTYILKRMANLIHYKILLEMREVGCLALYSAGAMNKSNLAPNKSRLNKKCIMYSLKKIQNTRMEK